jgi:hypothetical protein
MKTKINPAVRLRLLALYDEMMWLANRGNVTASTARSWYTHVGHRVKLKLRRFTGKVSKSAAEDDSATLRLEHFERIQYNLTKLVGRHRKNKKPNPDEFIRVLLKCEQVHIVTLRENYDAMRAKGDYSKAGITLLPWHKISPARRSVLWRKMLRGKVANSSAYAP